MNSKVKARAPRTEIGLVGASIPLYDILSLSEDEYRKRFAQNQISAHWINFPSVQRNALIALGNIGDASAIPLLKQYQQHQNEILVHTANWALNRLDHG